MGMRLGRSVKLIRSGVGAAGQRVSIGVRRIEEWLRAGLEVAKVKSSSAVNELSRAMATAPRQ